MWVEGVIQSIKLALLPEAIPIDHDDHDHHGHHGHHHHGHKSGGGGGGLDEPVQRKLLLLFDKLTLLHSEHEHDNEWMTKHVVGAMAKGGEFMRSNFPMLLDDPISGAQLKQVRESTHPYDDDEGQQEQKVEQVREEAKDGGEEGAEEGGGEEEEEEAETEADGDEEDG